jgi:hypothetical protein
MGGGFQDFFKDFVTNFQAKPPARRFTTPVPGFTEWELLRIWNHQMGFFVNYRITSTSRTLRPATS